MQPTEIETKQSRHRFLLRGESAVAFIGIGVAAILLGAMAASGWWTLRTQRETLQVARVREVSAVATSLAQSGEVMLNASELSALRRIVNDASANYELTRCRVTLPNGQVVADSQPARINVQHLPATWAESADSATQTITRDRVELTVPMIITGRGGATLRIEAPISYPFAAYWEAQAGVGAIGAVTMVALLLLYRRMRLQLRAMGAIREALLASEGSGADPAMLRVNDEFGAEAQAWNHILDEKEKMRQRGVAERAKEALANRRSGKGDLDAACDAMSQGLILIDEKMRVKFANGAAATFLRTKRDQATGQEIGALISDAKIIEAVQSTADGSSRRRVSIEMERLPEEGGGVLRFNVRPVRREDSAAAMIVIEDITQQRAAEDARHAFVAQVTHELRTPLTNIRLYVETAIEDGENDQKLQAKCLNVINVEARRLERIVGDMLSVAEIEAGSLKLRTDDVQLNTVFAELKDDYLPQAEAKNIVLTINLPPKFPQLKGDRDKLVLALHNVVGNAIKYTPEGGKVEVNIQAEAKQLVISVVDTGLGIKDEDIEHIFDKFYRAKDPRVSKIIGSGLGLTLAREVTRLHGGDITVQSQINKGSVFRLTLPAMLEAA